MPKLLGEPLVRLQVRLFVSDNEKLDTMARLNETSKTRIIRAAINTLLKQSEARVREAVDEIEREEQFEL